jgi:hypothetical protein
MEAQELRIGNYVNGDLGKYYKFELSDFYDWWGDHNSHIFGDHIHPIPLTEEWLLKFGFEFIEGEPIGDMSFNDNWTLGKFKINVWGNGWLFYWDDKWDNKLQYVHQLQNLYFTLTGKEL